MTEAFIIKFNDELEKYQIKLVNIDTIAKDTILFETREDANGGYIARLLQAKDSEKEKYFATPSLAYQD